VTAPAPLPDLSRCKLRELRRLAGFETQESLAVQLCVDRRSVLRWERGQTQPPSSLRLFLLSLISQNQAAQAQPQGDPRP